MKKRKENGGEGKDGNEERRGSPSEDSILSEWEQTRPEAKDVHFCWGNLLLTFALLSDTVGA